MILAPVLKVHFPNPARLPRKSLQQDVEILVLEGAVHDHVWKTLA